MQASRPACAAHCRAVLSEALRRKRPFRHLERGSRGRGGSACTSACLCLSCTAAGRLSLLGLLTKAGKSGQMRLPSWRAAVGRMEGGTAHAIAELRVACRMLTKAVKSGQLHQHLCGLKLLQCGPWGAALRVRLSLNPRLNPRPSDELPAAAADREAGPADQGGEVWAAEHAGAAADVGPSRHLLPVHPRFCGRPGCVSCSPCRLKAVVRHHATCVCAHLERTRSNALQTYRKAMVHAEHPVQLLHDCPRMRVKAPRGLSE